MNSYFTPLIVVPLADGKRWKLHEGFTYRYRVGKDTFIIQVPAGFVTDFASVPRIFQSIIPSWGKFGKASVLHDFCYSINFNSRRWSDIMFRKAMIASGTPTWKVNLMYWAVRVAGGFAWRNYLTENSKLQQGQL